MSRPRLAAFRRFATCSSLVVGILLAAGGCRENKNIFEAVQNGNLKDVKYFVEKRWVDINVKGDWDQTPLFYACYPNPNLEILKYLLGNGANVHAKDYKGDMAIRVAVIGDCDVEFLEFLIEKGADVNAIDFVGDTLLHNAAANNSHIDVLICLINHGLEVNAKNKSGCTPLHTAGYPNIEVMKYLIAQGADVNAKDNNGKTPLDWTNDKKKQAILREAGGKSSEEL